MKRNLTFLLGLFIAAGLQFAAVQNLNAQAGTQGDGFIFDLDLGTEVVEIRPGGDCGYGYASFGGEITEEFCAPMVWAFDITPDSLICDTVTMDLSGKIAVIRRGVCNFSVKVYYAQQAGAIAVIVVNDDRATDGPCTFVNMGGTTFADLITVPAIFLPRTYADMFDAALANGQSVQGCYKLLRMDNPITAYHYATPVSQVDTLDHLAVTFINRSDTVMRNVVIKADIEEPDGTIVSVEQILDSVEVNANTTVYRFVAGYLPPAVPGKFKVTFSNNVYAESRDTLVAYFEQTDYTWAADNLVLDPGGIANNTSFAAGNFNTQYGVLCLTGDNPGAAATYATFGLANAAALAVPNPLGAENDINVFLYDADVDDDGVWEFTTSSTTFDDMAGGTVGFATYQVQGTEGVDSLLNIELKDLLDPTISKVDLKPNHPYYISVSYNGVEAGTGIMPAYSNTLDVNYWPAWFTTPLLIDNMYSGWGGAVQILRLQLEGFDPTVSVKPVANLDVDIELLPNPAVDVLRVNLDFGKTTKSGTVSLMTGLGKVVRFERLSNFENGQLSFNVNDLPSGTYLLSVRTPDGVAIRKVMVCH